MICTPIRLALFAILENNLKAISRDILNEILISGFSNIVLDQWHLKGYFYKVLLFCSFALGETLTIKRDADEAPTARQRIWRLTAVLQTEQICQKL